MYISKETIETLKAQGINFNEGNISYIMMYARNLRATYCKLEWLAKCVSKCLKKAQPVSEEHLANCATMKAVVREASKWTLEGRSVTACDRREACRRLAREIITEWV